MSVDLQDSKGLERSERRYRSLVEAVHAAHAVWVADPTGQYKEDSPSWSALTGQTYEEFRGRGFLNAIHPEDQARVAEAWDAALENRSAFEIEFRLRMRSGDFQWYAARGVPVLDDGGRVLEWVGTVTDIHDHRTREGATRLLLQAEELFASTLDEETIFAKLAQLVVPRVADWCAVDLIDESGAIERVAIQHVDPSRIETAREGVRRFPPKSDVSFGIMATARSGKTQHHRDVSEEMLQELAHNADHLEWLRYLGMESFMIVPVVARGNTIGTITFGSADPNRKFASSDVRLAEEIARRVAAAIDNARLYAEAKEANRAKDLFLATLSHEMRTPLTAILGWARILELEDPPEKFREAIKAIEQSARVQQRLIEDLLDVSRIIAGKLNPEMQPTDLRESVRKAVEIVSPQAAEKSIAIRTEIPDQELIVEGDATRLQQIFWNLLTNALKFTPDGGLIEVTVAREGAEHAVHVRDTGRGIQSDTLPHIFETFRQSNRSDEGKGLGLGLAIVKKLAEIHGGSVTAFSEGLGQGATFTVRLPAG